MSEKHSRKNKAKTGAAKAATVEYLMPGSKLTLISGDRLLKLKHKRTHHHWGSLITSSMTGMLYGPRGAGKTYASLGIAVAMSTGRPFLGLAPSRPRSVVVLDGEMGSKLMKRRLKEMRKSLGADSLGNLLVLTPDMYAHPLPSLGTQKGQAMIDALIPDDTDVIIVDNMSCWNAGGGEDADAWNPWGEWLLKHKHLGRTVIMVHHAGKGGQQRGTSRKEDAMDFVMALTVEKDAEHPDALCFGIEWQKLRTVGRASAPALRVTRVEVKDKSPKWEFRQQPSLSDRVMQATLLQDDGMSMRAIAAEMGVNAGTVSRWLKDRSRAG